jgi:hypothetical protein
MTRAEALAALIAKVEAGSGIHDSRPIGEIDVYAQVHLYNAYDGSLDAALALHEAVVPGWEWTIFFNATTGHMAVLDGPDFSTPEIGSESPARAWLLAILRALHAMERGKQ